MSDSTLTVIDKGWTASWERRLERVAPFELQGSVRQVNALIIGVAGLNAPLGARVEVLGRREQRWEAEVVGFDTRHALICPLSNLTGVQQGDRVRLVSRERHLRVQDALLGRVLNHSGRPVSEHNPPRSATSAATSPTPEPTRSLSPSPSSSRSSVVFSTGVRAIDGLLTCAQGQRVGLFAGSGVGKTTLLRMMAQFSQADRVVVALIGERSREVREFVGEVLRPELRRKAVVVASTADEPPLARARAAETATAIAEHYGAQGHRVLFLMDSLTRYAWALRELGLALGEPPAARGFPASVFARLPQLVERFGAHSDGSITAFYTVLVDGDDLNEPVCDAVRGVLDGHIVLTRKLAERGCFPAIDINRSVSRLMDRVCDEEHRQAAQCVRRMLAEHAAHEDLLSLGAYQTGANREVDAAIALWDPLCGFLAQDSTERASLPQTRQQLLALQLEHRKQTNATHAPRDRGRSRS